MVLFFQAEGGIRDLVRSRGLGDVYKRQLVTKSGEPLGNKWIVLESTAAGATPGKFQYLKVTRTELDGSYSFFRPAASPPEDLKVRFKGLYFLSLIHI